MIQNGVTGVVCDPSNWVDIIYNDVLSGYWRYYGQNAREYAVSENWQIQAQRFNKFLEGKLND